MKIASLTSTSVRASKLAAVLIAGVLLAPAAFAADKAVAKNDGAGKIAVVDVQFLVSNSKAGKSIRNQLDSQRNAYRNQIEKQEKDLRNAEKALIDQQSKLSKDALIKKRKEFQDKVVNAQRSVQQRRVSFDKAYTQAMEKLREHIVKIVADAASKNDIALVLNRQEVVLVEEKMDMTKQILTKLDQTVSSIPVSIK